MSTINRKTVEHIAALVRIGLSEKETLSYQHHLSSILDYVDQLQRIDTNKTLPLLQVGGLSNIFRQDIVTNGNMREALLANTPMYEKGLIKVRTVQE